MIVFTIVTFGIYHILWYFLRRPALNQLDSPRKLPLWPMCAHAAVWATTLITDIVSAPLPRAALIGPAAAGFLSLALLGTAIVMLVMTFRIKDMLEDHLAEPEDTGSILRYSERVRLSGLMTFFFSIYYLQYVINNYIRVHDAARQLQTS